MSTDSYNTDIEYKLDMRIRGVLNEMKQPEMSDSVFQKFCSFIYDESGIRLNSNKKLMLSTRLSKRLRELGLDSYDEYFNSLRHNSEWADEIIHMINAVSTNKTDFFREEAHFDYLFNTVLSKLIVSESFIFNNCLNVWSAGCSTGEEPYTIAMVLADYFRNNLQRFYVTATDISTRVLKEGLKATYSENSIQPISEEYRKRFLLRGVSDQSGHYKITKEIRERVNFKYHNLTKADFNRLPLMDIIFCRNVVIYFDKPTQEALYNKLANQLNPGGYLFIGHSETIIEKNHGIDRVSSTVYRKKLRGSADNAE